MRVLMIDNYDSFTYNLVQYLQELGAEVLVHRQRSQMASERQKAVLGERQRQKFAVYFSKRLLNYALTRELQSGDFYTLVSARNALEESGYRPSAAVNVIVTSRVFLERSEE